MRLHVFRAATGSFERRLAHAALVLPLCVVQHLVPLRRLCGVKGLVALTAAEITFAGVREQMISKTRPETKFLSAVITDVWLLAGVSKHVSSESRGLRERLVAHAALVASIIRVNLGVFAEIVDVSETLSADRTHVWPLTRVLQLYVSLKIARH